MYNTIEITEKKLPDLINIEENYFTDVKRREIAPSKLSETISAFANAAGGDIYVGIAENTRTHTRQWDGFVRIEDANSIVQVLEELSPLQNFFDIVFLQHPVLRTYVMQITVMKAAAIVHATSGMAYVRKNAQNVPVNTDEKKRRLELDKGIAHFEDELLPATALSDAIESETMELFAEHAVPQVDKKTWLKKQKLCNEDNLNVAGALLFMDEPQVVLAKRSAIKVFRYKTSGDAMRETLDGIPLTIEGSAYNQIYTAVKSVKDIIENIKKIDNAFESIQYPDETLHEIITNAVLHRDYSLPTDIQIRIFDNRVEVESPGKLPGYVTIHNILDAQSARNPKIVRLINKFPNAPNKDVGEGLNTAFAAMSKIRLKQPDIKETASSVIVVIRHEKLASPEEQIVEYLQTHDSIRNSEGRKITGISSENTMKGVFISYVMAVLFDLFTDLTIG